MGLAAETVDRIVAFSEASSVVVDTSNGLPHVAIVQTTDFLQFNYLSQFGSLNGSHCCRFSCGPGHDPLP